VLIALDAVWIALLPSLAVGRYVLACPGAVRDRRVAVRDGAACASCPDAPGRRSRSPGSSAARRSRSRSRRPGEARTARGAAARAGPRRPAGIAYPVLGWLAMMMLGWAFGAHLLALRGAACPRRRRAALRAGGIASLALFALVRGANGYGTWRSCATTDRSFSGCTSRSTPRAWHSARSSSG
jgi:hypothetical protein